MIAAYDTTTAGCFTALFCQMQQVTDSASAARHADLMLRMSSTYAADVLFVCVPVTAWSVRVPGGGGRQSGLSPASHHYSHKESHQHSATTAKLIE